MPTPKPPGPGQSLEQLHRLREVQLRQLQFRRRSLGEDHPRTVESMESLSETLVSLGEHDRARVLQEQSLKVRYEVEGKHAATTTAAAWNLFHTLNRVEQEEDMRAAYHEHLAWLLQADPADLEEPVRRIKEWVQLLPKDRLRGDGED